MGFKYQVGKAIYNIIENVNAWNYKLLPFIPSGRILTLDLKRTSATPIVIFDVGANIGQTANNFVRHFKKATVYSFEPVESVYKELVANTSNPQIKCFNQALGDQEGEAKIYKSRTYSGIASINGADTAWLPDEETITVTTGLAICEKHQISSIDILKIDTEGYEINVLEGFKHLLPDHVKFIFIEVGFNPDNKNQTYIVDLLNYLKPYGFTISGFYNPLRFDANKLSLNHADLLLFNPRLIGK